MQYRVGPRPLVGSVNSNGVCHCHWYSNQTPLSWIGQYFAVCNGCGTYPLQSDIVMEGSGRMKWETIGLLRVQGKRAESLS